MPYAADVEAVLQRARSETFASAAYRWEFAPRPRPATLRELEAELECGTGTVIDALRTGSAPGLGIACVLSSDTLRRLFGTDAPTRDQVRLGLPAVWAELERGESAAIAAHSVAGAPEAWCFTGLAVDMPAFAAAAEEPATQTGAGQETPANLPLHLRLLAKLLGSGPTQLLQPSAALGAIIGQGSVTRTDATSRLWDYIHTHGLLDPASAEIRADPLLRPLLGKDRASVFELTQQMNAHLQRR